MASCHQTFGLAATIDRGPPVASLGDGSGERWGASGLCSNSMTGVNGDQSGASTSSLVAPSDACQVRRMIFLRSGDTWSRQALPRGHQTPGANDRFRLFRSRISGNTVDWLAAPGDGRQPQVTGDWHPRPERRNPASDAGAVLCLCAQRRLPGVLPEAYSSNAHRTPMSVTCFRQDRSRSPATRH